jgi:catechol 2,3-dioxygenase-like lactoylglutathione lyase family enzyme
MSLKLDLVGIVAKDIAESLRFYAELGLPVPEAGEDHVECTLPNGLRIAWDSLELMKQISDHWEEPKGHRMGLAFLTESPAAVDETYARIVAAGFTGHKAPWDAFWGQRYAQVQDPDGNVVDLFAPL